VSGRPVVRARITSTPPPPGRCTSSSTTSGRCSAIAATASSTSAASADDVDRRRRRARRAPAAEHRVVVDDHDPSRRAGRVTLLLSGRRQVLRRTSVPSPGSTDLGGAAVPLHAVDDAAAHAVAGPRGRRPGRSPAAVADEDVDRAGGDLGVDVDRAAPACLAALVTASRAARTIGRSASSRSQSPTATTSTATPCASSTSAAAPRSAPAGCGSSADSPGVQPGPQVALLGRASRATWRGSAEFFWISASVCSTESCRCAATSARSWVRTRSARSAAEVGGEPEDPRPTTSARPATPSSAAISTSRRHRASRLRSAKSTARTISATPARPGRTTPSRRLPNTIRTGSIRPVVSSQRSRWPRRPGATAARCRHADHDRPEHGAAAEHRLDSRITPMPERGQRDRRADVGRAGGPAGAPAAARRALQAGVPVSNRESAGSTSHRPA
jgi:hypothetical protein